MRWNFIVRYFEKRNIIFVRLTTLYLLASAV